LKNLERGFSGRTTLLPESGAQTNEQNDGNVQEAAQRAFLQLLAPLSDFALDSGLSITEVNSLFRQAAVHRAVARQLEDAQRVNISGIAAMTGISRAEISDLLNPARRSPNKIVKTRQKLTNRILAAWHSDPKFTTASGRPAVLKIYGRGATFESLVRQLGRGIPIRAILDEMMRSGAIEMRGSQEICPKKSVTSGPRITAQLIKSFADRASKLLSVTLDNLRRPDATVYVESASRTKLSPSSIPVLRRDFPGKSEELLAELQTALVRMHTRTRITGDVPRLGRLSVTIAYHEVPRKNLKVPSKKRRNFRRNS
jgi:Family of unknown function (DUF6502)